MNVTQGAVWEDSMLLAVPSGYLQLADPMLLFDDPLIVEVPPDAYSVRIKVLRDTSHVSQVRIYRGEDIKAGKPLGVIGIDFGQMAILNRAEPFLFQQYDSAEGNNRWIKALDSLGLMGSIPYGATAEAHMVVVRTGYGDGRYSVHELVGPTGRAGVEVVFIEE